MINNCLNDDEENDLKGIRTEPRSRKTILDITKSTRAPLSKLNQENNPKTNFEIASQFISFSEPVNNLKVRNLMVQNKSLKPEKKIDKQLLAKAIPKTKESKAITAKLLAEILEFDTEIDHRMDLKENDAQKLFEFLEKEGRLSPEILKVFCKSVKIRSINMTNSYSGIVGESGLISETRYPVKLCTRPLFSGFRHLISADFTNVKLVDDDLRYIIRLSKLQNLGLSGTCITDKGIKYISTHSSFKNSLLCIKLCFVQGVTDIGIKYLDIFAKLNYIDLKGNFNISLSGCLQLISYTHIDQTLDLNIRLPQSIQDQLKELHDYYKRLSCSNSNILLDADDIRFETMTSKDLRSQLKFHKQHYSGIYLNEDLNILKLSIYSILSTRKREENLYNCSVR